MPLKRKREATGLAAGEQLKRNKLTSVEFFNWNWVGIEVTDVAGITPVHRLATCDFGSSSRRCPNKYFCSVVKKSQSPTQESNEELIIVEDEPSYTCDKQTCRKNPNCLNYLGQEKWENAKSARQSLLKLTKFGDDPGDDLRENDAPVGLVNLGATCYANACLQVWFRNLPFRSGVYSCNSENGRVENSSIFQLQVTFAALQKSNQRVFNPIKLVESLRLRSEEQQDAQEFSKLFMSHLDCEFRTETHPSLRTLIPSQFQGSQAYGTKCHSCKSSSERTSEFYELEVNLTPDANLENMLTNLLADEILTGDNKYLCSNCNRHQDATRYSEIRRLPPVLHISLLRFVFDMRTLERKKSKHTVAFPTTLDMNPFVKSKDATNEHDKATNVYNLSGILLHKGTSAYHGHYIAQVYDTVASCWYQCNDELVTKVESLGGDALTSKSNLKSAAPKNGSLSQNGNIAHSPIFKDDRITSKDAYMLIYTQRTPPTVDSSIRANAVVASKEPPARALDVIKMANNAHLHEIENFLARKEDTLALYDDIRSHRMEIYQLWGQLNDYNTVVSRQALETWLSLPMRAPSKSGGNDFMPTLQLPCGPSIARRGPEHVEYTPCEIPISEVVCPHGLLDPRRASDMKRVSSVTCAKIDTLTNCKFVPSLTINDVCPTCVSEIFEERLYDQRHPEHVRRFDECCCIDLENMDPGFYVSKRWLKDWRSMNPKLRSSKSHDLPPNDKQFRGDTECEHGCLSSNASSEARVIPSKAYEFLRSLFPDWDAPKGDVEACVECRDIDSVQTEGRRDKWREGAAEKKLLKVLFDDTSDELKHAQDVPCALVPSEFLSEWRQWIARPTRASKPVRIHTSMFICEHEMLNVDPNFPLDMQSELFSLIRLSDWEVLKEKYEAGPLISLTNVSSEAGDGQPSFAWKCERAICEPCCVGRRTTFLHTELQIYITRDDKRVTVANGTNGANGSGPPKLGKGNRQSRRLQSGDVRKVKVGKNTSVKDIKLELEKSLKISPLQQTLSYQGVELVDGSATVDTLGILAGDRLDLRILATSSTFSTEDVEDVLPRTEGAGFGKTMLVDDTRDWSASTAQLEVATGPKLPCPTCTFDNAPDTEFCLVCDTPFT